MRKGKHVILIDTDMRLFRYSLHPICLRLLMLCLFTTLARSKLDTRIAQQTSSSARIVGVDSTLKQMGTLIEGTPLVAALSVPVPRPVVQ